MGRIWMRRMVALLAALVCLGGVAQASTVEERVAGLYANPEAIESLWEGVIPHGWEDVLEPIYVAERFKAYRCREYGLDWHLSFDAEEDSHGRLIFATLSMWRPLDGYGLLSFGLYEGLCQEDASFHYNGNALFWGVEIPRETCVEALTEFVALAAFCTSPAEELDDDELDDRDAEIAYFLRKWREKFPIQYEGLHYKGLNSGDQFTCIEADYMDEVYALYTQGDHERLRYALTAEQFKAVYDACTELEPEKRAAYTAGYAAALGQAPERILELYDESYDYHLSAVFYDDEFLLLYYGDDVFLDEEQYDAFAAEWLPLSPAERTAPMREAYERLSGK